MVKTHAAPVATKSMKQLDRGRSGTASTPVMVRRSSLSKADVAELTVSEISDLPVENLACAVQTAELRFLQGNRPTRLESLSRDALERLAFLARRCCRNQGY